MFSQDLGEILDDAESEEATKTSSGEVWEAGQYKIEVSRANANMKFDTPQLGLLFTQLEGPTAGVSRWFNIRLGETNQLKKMFVDKVTSLGVTKETLRDLASLHAGNLENQLKAIAEMLTGTIAVVEVQRSPQKADASKFTNYFKVLHLVNDQAADASYGDLLG